MRKFLTAIVLGAMICSTASAQVRSQKVGGVAESNSITYALPRTTLRVTVETTKESIRTGPYARFAQKFLGVIAPLANKDIYTISGASITYGAEADPQYIYILDNPEKNPFNLYTSTAEGFMLVSPDGVVDQTLVSKYVPLNAQKLISVGSHISSDTSFVKVSVDRRDIIDRTVETMAADAARMIYALRQRRFELITGEAGENVFGAGLKSAIDEINRLENEYLALFMGKQFKEAVVSSFDVIPESDKATIIVCRFSDTAGILPANDLTGRPILLEMSPEKKAQQSAITRRPAKDSRGLISYRIADMVNCRLVDGKQELAQDRIPIYQFGVVVDVPVTSLK